MGQSSANGFYDSSVNFEFPTPLEKAQVVASSSAPLANIQDIQTYKLSNCFLTYIFSDKILNTTI
jgi:hypothetical protein